MSELRPPSGHPPPERATLPAGDVVELGPLAREVCRRYREEYPDEEQRYGDAGIAWCVHDNQHILNWAVLALNGYLELEEKLTWLAGVLEARDFPLDRLARDLELAAAVAKEAVESEGDALAELLAGGALHLRSKPSFL